jgi:phenylacetate-CoA ligase
MWPLGRKSDEIVVDGVSVLPLDVWGAVESVDACAMSLFQVIRAARKVDRLSLRVGYAPEWSTRLGAVRSELMAAVLAATGVEPNVELVPNDALLRLGPPHKIPRVARS